MKVGPIALRCAELWNTTQLTWDAIADKILEEFGTLMDTSKVRRYKERYPDLFKERQKR